MNKATYKYVFNRKNKDTEISTIELRITLNRKTKYFSTKIKINNKYWDIKKNKVKSTHPNYFKINNVLLDKIQEFENIEYDFIKDKVGYDINSLSQALKQNKDLKTESFTVWANSFVSEDERISKATKKKRMVVVNRLKIFREDIKFYEINYSFLNNFDNYLHTVINKKTGKPIQQVTIHNNIKILKTLLHQASREGKILNVPNYRVPKGENDKEALTLKELAEIENLNFDSEPVLKITRDMFVFSCYTALRFSDVLKLTLNNLRYDEDKMFLYLKRMQKVNKPLNLPLNVLFEGKARLLIEKYIINKTNSDVIFDAPTNQTINRNLKIIKALANIKKNLTFHISRHTCLTLIGQKSGNPFLIMKIAGHSDIKTSMKYTQGVIDDKLFDLL